MDEISRLKGKADVKGSEAAGIELTLMKRIDLSFIERHEMEIVLYSLRLEQSKYNLRYQEALKFLEG